MPYVKQGDREYLRKYLIDGSSVPEDPGPLNFCITTSMINHTFNEDEWFNRLEEYVYIQGKSYTVLNEIMGVLICAWFEVKRRDYPLWTEYSDRLEKLGKRFYDEVIAPYEDIKIKENGDVYDAEGSGTRE